MEMAALWISFVAAAGGIAAAVIAWFARADALQAQEKADAAQRDAAISEGRSVAAAETIARIQSANFDGPPWVVSFLQGDSFLLTNSSPVDALGVTVAGAPDGVVLEVAGATPRTVGAKSALKFAFAANLGTPWERDIVVNWKRADDGPTIEWRHPLPAKPPRT